MATRKTRDKIIRAFLSLLGEKGWEGTAMTAIAAQAGVSLAALRAEFPTKLSIYEAFLAGVDSAVLDGVDDSMAGEPARDRLFDVLMIRLDHLKPYKSALLALRTAARRDPLLAIELAHRSAVAQRWMLTAAGIEARGFRGRLMVQGLVVAFARVIGVWLEDEDPGLARTMAALDRELSRGESWLGRLDRLERMTESLRSSRKRRRSNEEPMQERNDDGENAAVA